MRILFEEHQYEVTEEIQRTLKDVASLQDVEKKISVSYVGYFYNSAIRDCVFILPKVLLKDRTIEKNGEKKTIEILADVEPKDKSSGRDYITPENIITKEGQEKYLSEEYRKFVYEFAVWIYRTLCVYRKSHRNSKAIYFKELPQSGKGKRHEANTYLDILLSLIRFNHENQNFFMFTIRNLHSGMNKINWTKTISKSQAFLTRGGVPIYLDPVNKKRKINFDEELFIIFFSILNHINKKYGFKAPINFQYELINEPRFEYYLNGYGANRLRQIKYKYFSDKALILWDLCYAFFDSAHQLAVNTDQREYLLAKSFEHVFEAMIDELIGDSDIPKGLKEQDDGKRVDHMYTYDALTRSDEDQTDEQIYYIGDSKYYKSGHRLGRQSIYKQYTYARNVVQWNIDLFMRDELATRNMTDEEKKDYLNDKHNSKFNHIRLRKDGGQKAFDTEGYAVIPNFFLSAYVEKDRRYDGPENIHIHTDNKGEHATYLSCQFENRLFDRDTLILSHYDVNFLYVIYLYARNKSSEKLAWQRKVRRIFRDEIREVLRKKYDFYALTPLAEGADEQYLQKNFHKLLGKIYTPYNNARYNARYYALALEKSEAEGGSDLRKELEQYFFVTSCDLGLDPDHAMQTRYGADYLSTSAPTYKLAQTTDDEIILVGCVKSEDHWEWILESEHYNIPLEGAVERNGALKRTKKMMLVSKVLLYLYNNEEQQTPKYLGLFNIKDQDAIPLEYKYSELRSLSITLDYPSRRNTQGDARYLVYDINTEVGNEIQSNESLDKWLQDIVEEQEIKGQAMFFTGSDLKAVIRPDEVKKEEEPSAAQSVSIEEDSATTAGEEVATLRDVGSKGINADQEEPAIAETDNPRQEDSEDDLNANILETLKLLKKGTT